MGIKLICVVLLCWSCFSTTRGKPGNTAELLRRKIIRDFLESFTEMAINHPDRKMVTKMVIEEALGTPTKCLQMASSGTRCLWSLSREPEQSRDKREVSILHKANTKHFMSQFVLNLAKKSFPQLTNQIISIFSNETDSFLKLPTDTVKRIETASNLILLRSVQRISDATSQLKSLKIPLLTLCSIIIFMILLLVASCTAKQVSEWRLRRSANKQRRLEAYFTRRTLQDQLNLRSPSYEAVIQPADR